MDANLYHARHFSFRIGETVSREYEHSRLNVLDKMLTGDYDAVVLSAEAAMQLTIPPQVLMSNSMSISQGEDHDIEVLTSFLISSGYARILGRYCRCCVFF